MDKYKVGSTIDGELDRILAAMKSIHKKMKRELIGIFVGFVIVGVGIVLPSIGGLLVWLGGVLICAVFIGKFNRLEIQFEREVGKFDGIVFVTDWLKAEIEKEKSQKPDGQQ